MLKLFIPVIIVLVLAGGGFYLYQASRSKSVTQETTYEKLTTSPPTSPLASPQVSPATDGPCEVLTKGSVDLPTLYAGVQWQIPTIGEYDVSEDSIASGEFLINGDLIFNRTGEDNCIRRLKHGRTGVECIVDARYGNETYEYIYLIAVSPDGKRMAFRRGKISLKPGGRFYAYQHDLFVREFDD